MKSDKLPDHIDLTVIIVSWNVCELLLSCLQSVIQHTRRYSFEIIVVDNDSMDNTVSEVQSRFASVRLIVNNVNVGFARANNQAYAVASGRYVALLNPDTRLLNGALDAMIAYLDRSPDCGAVGPKLVGPDGAIQYSCARRSLSLATEILEMVSARRWLPKYLNYWEMGNWDHKSSRDVPCLSGACMVVHRDAVRPVLLNEDYFMYGEDVELCWHIREKAGLRIHYLAEACVLHFGNQSGRQADGMAVEVVSSAYHYLRQTSGGLTANIARVLRFLAACARILINMVILLTPNSQIAKVRLQDQLKIARWAIGWDV